MTDNWASFFAPAGTVKPTTLSDYTWPDPSKNAMTLLNAANVMDERKQRQAQTNVLMRKNALEEEKGDIESFLTPLVGVQVPGQPMLPTSVGYVAKSNIDAGAKKFPRGGNEEYKTIATTIAAQDAERRKAQVAAAQHFVTGGEPEAAAGLFNAAYPGSFPGVGGESPASTNAMPQSSPTAQPQGSTNALPQTAASIAGRYVAPGGMVPGQTNALTPAPATQAPLAGRIFIDLGGNRKGMTTEQELASSPEGRRLLSGMNMGGAKKQPVGSGQAAPVSQPTGQQPMFRSTQIQNKMNDIIGSSMTNTEKRKALEALVPMAGANTRMLTAIRTEAALLAGDEKQSSRTAEQLINIRNNDPDPSKRAKAAKELKDLQEFNAASAGSKSYETEKSREKAQEMDPEDAKEMGKQYVMTGTMPQGLGLGSPGMRKQIIHEGTQWAKQNGMNNVNLALKQLQYKADQRSLTKTSEIAAMTENYEKTVESYIPILKAQSAAVKRVPIRSIAELQMRVEKDMIGDPDAKVFYGTLYETLVDYSKVVTGNFGMGGLTDSARVEGQKLLSVADKPETFNKVLDNFQVLMNKRTGALKGTAEGILKKYNAEPKAAYPNKAATASPPAGYTNSGKTVGGKAAWVSPDGKQVWVAE